MARKAPQIPGIEPITLPESRQAIPVLHTYLRECILNGILQPGTKLSQVGLAEQLGVSRTPLREVLRMLQEEGLVEIEPNQRTKVAGFDPQELDYLYASRILHETLALSMGFEHLTATDRRQAKQLLSTMRRAARARDLPAWFQAHASFHHTLTKGPNPTLDKELSTLADRAVRYIRIYQQSEPAAWQDAGDAEHEAILQAVLDGDGRRAVSELAHHLARTALRVMIDCAPDYVPLAVPQAIALVEKAHTGRSRTRVGAQPL